MGALDWIGLDWAGLKIVIVVMIAIVGRDNNLCFLLMMNAAGNDNAIEAASYFNSVKSPLISSVRICLIKYHHTPHVEIDAISQLIEERNIRVIHRNGSPSNTQSRIKGDKMATRT